ncbi:MAG TPA: PAS domain S-box protein, partial [Steroidobacteraceae bacterium]|nr:PAS domain S-box protein [Steroidobacteraceae bacterium]
MNKEVDPSFDVKHDALRISEARYRRLFETARDGILLLNADTAQIEDANPYLVELLGYTHAEFLGKKLWEVGDFIDVVQSKQMFRTVQTSGYVRYANLPLKTASGSIIPVEFVSNAYECEGVKVIQCNIRDITAHQIVDLALREFKAIVEASDDAIISKSLQGVIKSWNPGAVKLFGYEAVEAIDHPISIVIPADRRDEEASILARIATGQRVDHFETVSRHKDGHLFDISATISPIFDGDHKVVGAAKIARDITERKRTAALRESLEDQLRESQKMEAIGTLAGGIAHDFNNIIATILGNADLALEDTLNNQSAQTSIGEIRKAGRRARDLVQQILSFSRRQPMERKLITLTPIVEESVRLMRATFPANVKINLQCDADIPQVMADATQIEQALLNLATNSMQAVHGAPQTIDISLDTIILDASFAEEPPALRAMHLLQPTRTARLTVRDKGPGMNAETLGRIFEPFFTTKPVGEGTGLGLSVVRGILQAHEGAIVVASQIGTGSTFTLYLPIPDERKHAVASDNNRGIGKAVSNVGAGRRLFYIDDDESIMLLVKRILERRGYVVSAFVD